MRAGILIVLEGPEGAGKSTQAARLAHHAASGGVAHLVLREPGGTSLGERIRELLLEPGSEIAPRAEALLFMASRAELVQCVVEPALREGKVVFLDRFFLSTYAYQVGGRGLPEPDVRAANDLATGNLRPNLTLLLSIDSREGLRRAAGRSAGDRMELMGDSFHERVARAFKEFESKEWQRQHPECGEIVAIDASRSEGEVFVDIVAALAERWPARFRGT